ncbi:MAG: bifunctional (p)ppGpp synthetase/guanosine-3',5'-bis(diphosphate) 3'-pyrophosphohydrolase, partial [bacterium]
MERKFIEDLNEIFAKTSPLISANGRALIEKAFRYAYEAHRGKKRDSQEPYFVHCVEVGKILAELKLDDLTISGGLLHDVVEDTGIPLSEIEREFGPAVSLLVDGVTKISELRFESIEARQAANFRKMLLSMSTDIRVILIKFADRLHNMRTIEHLKKPAQERISMETMEVYAPLAHRFGMAKLKSELEDMAFRVLNPAAYDEIAKELDMKKEERDRYIASVLPSIREEIKKFGINAEIYGRAKHLYSIYNKIQQQNKSFNEILDLLAIRVIVDRHEECYFVLGVIHNLFTPEPETFADYIAVPKSNMYQSLHTKVLGPAGKKIEFQIRTQKMHTIAEYGIASHWRYKEDAESKDSLQFYVNWVKQLLDLQNDSSTPQEFLETLRQDLPSDEVYVFTPQGKVIILPKGATPVDFAFAVHSDVGMHCIGVKVNQRMVSLNHELQSGNTVEIITSHNQKPSQDWLRFVVSARARSKIKRWLKTQQFQQSIRLGRELMVRELSRLRLKLTSEQQQDLIKESGYPDEESFYAALGNGDLTLQSLIGKLSAKKVLTPSENGIIRNLIQRVKVRSDGVKIQGMDDILISFAECCRPLPGDKITGFITTGQGISVHRMNCKNARALMADPDRT